MNVLGTHHDSESELGKKLCVFAVWQGHEERGACAVFGV